MIGPELGLTLPGTDDRLRRQPHQHPRRLRGAGLRHRHQRGRARPGHADALARASAARRWASRSPAGSPPGLEPKDIILAVIRAIGTGGGTGHVIEYYGPAISALSMEGRMTICNMSIEAGARAGLIAPDDTTFEYLATRRPPVRPQGRGARGGRSPTGRRSGPTTPRPSTATSRSTPRRSSRRSPGGRTRR